MQGILNIAKHLMGRVIKIN